MSTATVPSERVGGGSTRMSAHAMVSTALRPGADGRLRSRVTALRSEVPLVPRAAIAKEREPWAAHADDFVRVCVAAGAAGPIGGDRLRLDVHVGAGSSLVLTEVSATLLLPGRDGARSRTDVRITVEEGGTLVWLPEPVIAARACHHLNDVRVDAAAGARLLVREEIVLGRHRESPGRLRQRTRVQYAGRPAYCQELELGTATAESPAVAAGNRAVGSLLVIDPTWGPGEHGSVALAEQAALMPLATGGVLVSALAEDSLGLRRQLNAGLSALGTPWDPAG